MAVLACAFGGLSVALGLLASLQWDTPSGPSVVVAAFLVWKFKSEQAKYDQQARNLIDQVD